jgi:hypothetical protein
MITGEKISKEGKKKISLEAVRKGQEIFPKKFDVSYDGIISDLEFPQPRTNGEWSENPPQPPSSNVATDDGAPRREAAVQFDRDEPPLWI